MKYAKKFQHEMILRNPISVYNTDLEQSKFVFKHNEIAHVIRVLIATFYNVFLHKSISWSSECDRKFLRIIILFQ